MITVDDRVLRKKGFLNRRPESDSTVFKVVS
jgi:hypothetical protein